jgi:hypothetical protein
MKKINKLSFKTVFFGILLILAFNSFLMAQDSQKDNVESQDSSLLRTHKNLPILNGFRFIPSDVVKDPFINTFIKLNIGSGAALGLESYVRNLQGNVFDTLSGDLSYINGEIEFQYAINNWLAVSGNYNGSGRLGNNAYTILTSGISYTTGYGLAGKIKIWQNEKMFLSGSIEYSSNKVSLYSFYDFVKMVYETGGNLDSAKNSLLQKENLPQTLLNLNYAYAPTNWFGFLGVAGFGVGKSFERKDRGNIRLGAAASIDFLNVKYIHFPIGILASVRYNKFSETGENIDNLLTYGFRIGYTGHKDFDIGIENTYQNLNYSKSDQKVKTLLTSFKIRYYF